MKRIYMIVKHCRSFCCNFANANQDLSSVIFFCVSYTLHLAIFMWQCMGLWSTEQTRLQRNLIFCYLVLNKIASNYLWRKRRCKSFCKVAKPVWINNKRIAYSFRRLLLNRHPNNWLCFNDTIPIHGDM